MKNKSLMLLAASMTVTVSCTLSIWDSNLAENESILNFDKTSVEVEAASFHADEKVTDTVIVTASRSWSLAPVVESPWLSVSRDNGLNLGKVRKEWPVIMSFEDNTLSEERLVDLSVSIEGDRVLLPVKQKAFTPVLTLKSESIFNIPEVGDTVTLEIRSNSRWTARVEESSTAKLSLSASEGYKSGSLYVVIQANSDTKSSKEATVVLSAEGVEDVNVSITQDICIPRLVIDSENSETDVLPAAGYSKLIFDTNEDWTATLAEGASEGVALSSTEGSPADELSVYFPTATLDGASATVVITTASGLTESVTYVQRGCVIISFRMWPDNNGWGSANKTSMLGWSSGTYDIPRSSADTGAPGIWYENDSDGRKYTYWNGSTEGQCMFHSEACGLTIGSIVENPAFYIEFPAIEGKTLKEFKLMLGNSDVKFKDNKNCEATATGTTGFIADATGVAVAGGELKEVRTYQKDADWNATNTIPSFYSDYFNHSESMMHFVLTGTEPGTAYRYYGEYRQVIRWFILYYE